MLSQLTLRNFAIVDRLEIDWHAGLNVITGETGAGKSILIDAVGALLGDRLGPEVVRSGAPRAMIEGVFSLPPDIPADLAATLHDLDLEPEDGALIVNREIAGSGGRGSARVNGRGVPLSVLVSLGERLVDVHGQSEHMALLRTREQLDYLDRYASAMVERGEVGRIFRDLRSVRVEYQQLLASERESARLQDMLRHEINEIEAAHLDPGEEDELTLQRARLEHVERLRQAAQLAVEALGGGDETDGATELLARAIAAAHDGGRIDPNLATEADTLQGALDQIEDSARTLRDYLEGIEADPHALDEVVERLFRIGDLKRKYGETIADVLAYADEARGRLGDIGRRSERLGLLDARASELEAELEVAAFGLSQRRRVAAAELAVAVQRELRDLRLAEAGLFEVRIEAGEVDVTGADRVEFRLGEERRAMARVASGGELARIALALKTVLTRAETRPTLIFDEVDVGVGGRTGPVVGQKLWSVARGHQVLCVTHMAQVASFADHHYVVSRTSGEVCVAEVSGEQRLDEVAAMLAGSVTTAARQSAQELLHRAAAAKSR